MKKFVNPDIEVLTFSVEDVLTASNKDISNPTPED